MIEVFTIAMLLSVPIAISALIIIIANGADNKDK